MTIPKLADDEIFEVVFATTKMRNSKTRENWTVVELEAKAKRINEKKRGGIKRARVSKGQLLIQTTDPRGFGPYSVVSAK